MDVVRADGGAQSGHNRESRAKMCQMVDPWQDDGQRARATMEGHRGGSPEVGNRDGNKEIDLGKTRVEEGAHGTNW